MIPIKNKSVEKLSIAGEIVLDDGDDGEVVVPVEEKKIKK